MCKRSLFIFHTLNSEWCGEQGWRGFDFPSGRHLWTEFVCSLLGFSQVLQFSPLCTVFPSHLNNSASVEELSADGCPQISLGQLSFR